MSHAQMVAFLLVAIVIPVTASATGSDDIDCTDSYTFCAMTCSSSDGGTAISEAIDSGGDPTNNNEAIVSVPGGVCTWRSKVVAVTGTEMRLRIDGAGIGVTEIDGFQLDVNSGGSNIIEFAHLSVSGDKLFDEGKFRPAGFPNSTRHTSIDSDADFGPPTRHRCAHTSRKTSWMKQPSGESSL